MKCAACERESSPGKGAFGNLFVPTRTLTTRDPGGMFRDPSITSRHAGGAIEWFVCDSCASKGHDTTGVVVSVVAVIVVLLAIVGGGPAGPAYGVILGVPAAIASIYSLSYWWKDDDYKSKYCRDNVLQKSFRKLSRRADFVAAYGDIEPTGEPMTRFQREEL